jgi:hypothetical protein
MIRATEAIPAFASDRGGVNFLSKFGASALQSVLRLTIRASARPHGRKSAKAVAVDISQQILAACSGDSLTAYAAAAFARSGIPLPEAMQQWQHKSVEANT